MAKGKARVANVKNEFTQIITFFSLKGFWGFGVPLGPVGLSGCRLAQELVDLLEPTLLELFDCFRFRNLDLRFATIIIIIVPSKFIII